GFLGGGGVLGAKGGGGGPQGGRGGGRGWGRAFVSGGGGGVWGPPLPFRGLRGGVRLQEWRDTPGGGGEWGGGGAHRRSRGSSRRQRRGELPSAGALPRRAEDSTADRFDTLEPQRPPEPERLAMITLVPVPKTVDPSGKGEVFAQIEAFSQVETDLGEGWKLK